MPKGNPGRLKDRFEIHGALIPNEYAYQQQHGEMTEDEHENFPPTEGQDNVPEAGSSPQQQRRERIAEVEARAHETVERRRAKQSKSAQSGVSKGVAQKSAGKSSAKKSAAKKGRGASKGSASGGAKKSAAKRGAKKSSGKKSGGGADKSAKAGARKVSAKRR